MIFCALSSYQRPGLHVWRPGTNVRRFVTPMCDEPDEHGWFCFSCALDASVPADVHFKLYDRQEDDSPSDRWEAGEHNRVVLRGDSGTLPEQVWFAQGSSRVLLDDPMFQGTNQVRIHLITANRYRDGLLLMWAADGQAKRKLAADGLDEFGPYWDVPLQGRERHLFNFKFLRPSGGGERDEPDFANRVYASQDGPEVWTHSEGRDVATASPVKKMLTVNFQQQGDFAQLATMHLWQESSDFATDVAGQPAGSWMQYQFPIYGGLPYRFKFLTDPVRDSLRWEHDQATRSVVLRDDRTCWTLEGDAHLFDAEPVPDRLVEIRVSHRVPREELAETVFAHVWINRARWPIHVRVESTAEDPQCFRFATYPHVTTAFQFTDGRQWESGECHTVRLDGETASVQRHVVIGRPATLQEPPPLANLFTDPPFLIRRPGVYEDERRLRFVLHAPDAARARVVGAWTNWKQDALEMRSARDGSYWWATVPVAELESRLPPAAAGDYHGAGYKFLLDDDRYVQDPAAGWVEESSSNSNSRLIKQSGFRWHDQQWQIPSWDYLTVYQIHPKRFTDRSPGSPPLVQVAKEIEGEAGYLRDFGITAILLMPVNEVGSSNSWGYDPAFFYAVERDYGGPEALKQLVDTCHRHGLAVLLDVVFNHAGSDDNILWQVAQKSYFDGDTRWGAMINFDQPQCRHFFEQNLVYWQREFHIDGFRLDHTHTIVHSHQAGGFVRQAGSGGGWQFLHGLRHALHRDADRRAILTAEHLPNDWALTNYGGPMDSQWCDDFHDRLVDACRGHRVMPQLAAAMQLSHTCCDEWYNVTNYPESHDEVGNVNDRIANVAGHGRGLRMSKVAAAASLLSRGIPMFFMGAESGEFRQFRFGSSDVLDLTAYQQTPPRRHVRQWWHTLCQLRRSESIKGPARLEVRYAEDQLLAFSRGLGDDYFVVLNFGGWAGWMPLAALNLPNRRYRELWNSTWPAFAVEGEDEHTNGGRDAHLHRGHSLHVPDYGVVILERM
jgi:1,4-alpha-glucan branching enzyme